MEKKLFSGYFCLKCKMIPLIQIIPKLKNIKVLSSCKCNKQYQNIEAFIKNKYKDNLIDINQISKESIINDDNIIKYKIDINLIIDKLNKIKEKINIFSIEIKDKIINYYKKKIEEMNEIYNNYLIRNNKIILILEQIIKSYQLIEDNTSNIFNILTNFNFNEDDKINTLLKDNNMDTLSKEIEKYFKFHYIMSKSFSLNNKKSKYFFNENSPVKCFIEIDNNTCAFISNYSKDIKLCNLSNLNKEVISFKAHQENVNWIIKPHNSNLISCGEDGLIKIWPKITHKYFEEKKNLDIKEIKTYNYYNIKQITNINLNSIFAYEYNEKRIKFEKMILLKENNFIASSKNIIFLFKYLIDQDKQKIELIKNYEIRNLVDIFIIEKDKNEIIVLYDKNCLFFLDIPNFKIIKKFNMKSLSKNSLLQLNQKELLIIDSVYYYKIFDLDTFKFKLNIKDYSSADFLLNMNDGTFIFSCIYGIKRFLIKTMEELPKLIKFDNDDFYDYYESDYYSEKIIYIYKLKDGRIVFCHQNGKIEINNINLI